MMALLKRSTPAERAFAELDKARETVARWQTEQSTKAAELADLESRIGDEVLADETAAQRLTADVTRLRAEIDVAGRTAVAASSRVVDAGRAVLKAHAAELKANADHLRAEVEQRQAKTDAMLKALTDWEGATYLPYEPSTIDVVSAGAAGVRYTIPKTHMLRNQVKTLDAKAAEYEQHASGTPEQVAHHVAKLAGQNQTPAPVPVAG